jgi:hypothetical protein
MFAESERDLLERKWQSSLLEIIATVARSSVVFGSEKKKKKTFR